MSDNKIIGITCIAFLFGVMLGTVSHGQDAMDLAVVGSRLSDEEAQKLEDQLEADPNDLSLRTKLIGHYWGKRFQSDSARKAHQKHVIWIIQNRPDAQVAGTPHAQLNAIVNKESYDEAKQLWLEQVKAHERSIAILGNAASFFLLYDRDLAEDLLKRAQTLEPANPEWPERLGNLYALGMIGKSGQPKREAAVKSLEQLATALNIVEMKRYSILPLLARAAFEAGDFDKARTYAAELLTKAPDKNHWNYGNAVHAGNLILGRLALKSGDLEKAKEHLIEAGKTPGSPQLNSFGPNMTLAKELLEKGEKEAVIKYFQLCANFWRPGKDRLKKWTSIVEEGGIPNWGGNLNY